MIIAIANQHPTPARSLLACTLAVLRARSGRRVCVVDTESRKPACKWCAERSIAGLRPLVQGRFSGRWDVRAELRRLSLQFNDILVDAGHQDSAASRDAFAAARLVLVPVCPEQLDLASQYALISRINAARAVNPGLRAMLALVSSGEVAPEAAQALLAFAARLPAAASAPLVVSMPPGVAYGAGRVVCDAELCDPAPAAQMAALYRAIYLPGGAPPDDASARAPALAAAARFLGYVK